MKPIICIILAAGMLAACTQRPAPVSYGGRQQAAAPQRPLSPYMPRGVFVDRNITKEVAQAEPAPMPQVTTRELAAPQPVAVAELPPPTQMASAQPAQASLAAEPKEPFEIRSFDEPEPVSARPQAGPVAGPVGNFDWPVRGNVLSDYGTKAGGRFNDGVNIAARQGSAFNAAAEGEVAYVGSGLEGYGNMVIVRHPDGFLSAYAHADQVVVQKGQMVQAGQQLGTVGTSGGVNQPQLHFSLRNGTEPVDPRPYLPQ